MIMSRKEKPFPNLDLPKTQRMRNHKRCLRRSLLAAHQDYSMVRSFGTAISNTIQTMSILQKSTTASALVIAAVLVAAGIFGPSAFSVANAQAQETVNRAFARLANLSAEERATLEENFGERIQFKRGEHGPFMRITELSPEEIKARHKQKQASLAGTLIEAQKAPDLQVISADEMPTPGFFGRAGRAFGFKMVTNRKDFEAKLASLPEDVQQRFANHAELRKEMVPTSFMIYTNPEGQKVTLGINADNEPVIKFFQSEGGEPPFSHSRRSLSRKS